VSFHYELKARSVWMFVVPGLFVYHQRNQNGHNRVGWSKLQNHTAAAPPPIVRYNWMVGESCWPAFARRVQREYNFNMSSEMQDWITDFMLHNISLNPSLRMHVYRDRTQPDSTGPVEPICAAVQDNICVRNCRPPYARLEPGQSAFRFFPARDDRGRRQSRISRLERRLGGAGHARA